MSDCHGFFIFFLVIGSNIFRLMVIKDFKFMGPNRVLGCHLKKKNISGILNLWHLQNGAFHTNKSIMEVPEIKKPLKYKIIFPIKLI